MAVSGFGWLAGGILARGYRSVTAVGGRFRPKIPRFQQVVLVRQNVTMGNI
jgi:hypothetical protein